jgi:hypothetical protein
LLFVAILVVVGTSVAYLLGSQVRAPTSNATVQMRDVAVTRGDLVVKVNIAGTLVGTALEVPASAEVSGTVTWLSPNGTVVSRGETLFRIDNRPVVLLYGSTPSWRAFGPGMTDGPDLAELQTNLLALGFGQRFGLVADGHYSDADRRTVAAFAQTEGIELVNDVLAFGGVVFEPGPVLVVGHRASLGSAVSPGTQVLDIVGMTPQVIAQVGSSDASLIGVGIPASVTLAQGQPMIAGSVVDISSTPLANVGSGPGSNTTPDSGQTLFVTIALANPPQGLPLQGAVVAVQLKVKVLHDVLIVPVTALVALVEGGYALQIDDGHGRSHLVPVTVGAIDAVDALVQVTGPSVRAGLSVEVPAG